VEFVLEGGTTLSRYIETLYLEICKTLKLVYNSFQ